MRNASAFFWSGCVSPFSVAICAVAALSIAFSVLPSSVPDCASPFDA